MVIQDKAMQAWIAADRLANCDNSKLCAEDALELFVKAKYQESLNRSLKSLSYSVGITSSEYQKYN